MCSFFYDMGLVLSLARMAGFFYLHKLSELWVRQIDPDVIIPSDEDDPVRAWDECDPEVNVGRFAVYIEWLWQQEQSFELYDRLLLHRWESFCRCCAALSHEFQRQ